LPTKARTLAKDNVQTEAPISSKHTAKTIKNPKPEAKKSRKPKKEVEKLAKAKSVVSSQKPKTTKAKSVPKPEKSLFDDDLFAFNDSESEN